MLLFVLGVPVELVELTAIDFVVLLTVTFKKLVWFVVFVALAIVVEELVRLVD